MNKQEREQQRSELEYDLQWGSIFVEYDRFISSKFAQLDTSLYDCIELYFADKFLINK